MHPATDDRFDDVALVLAPKDPDAPACWCLSYRISNQEQRTLTGRERPARLRRYAQEGVPPGVIAYVGTTELFESVGFERVVATGSKSAGMTRWLMRRNLKA